MAREKKWGLKIIACMIKYALHCLFQFWQQYECIIITAYVRTHGHILQIYEHTERSMQHTAYLLLEGASPQHTAASGVNQRGPGLPEPHLETKPWSSSAGDVEREERVT